jgi:hypothetical protein
MVEDHDGLRKYEGPALNGASQDVAMEDLHVDSNGLAEDTNGAPPPP